MSTEVWVVQQDPSYGGDTTVGVFGSMDDVRAAFPGEWKQWTDSEFQQLVAPNLLAEAFTLGTIKRRVNAVNQVPA